MALVSVVAYAASLRIPFIWDDVHWIVDDANVHSLSSIPRFFAMESEPPLGIEGGNTGKIQLYRPLVKAVYAVEWALFGPDPLGYHVVNVVLNALVGVLFLLVVRRISGEPLLALAAALLYAVNPVRAEAVYWIYGLSEILLALSIFGALWLYHEGRLAAATLCFLPGLFVRETAVLFPAVLLAYEWLLRRGEGPRRFLKAVPFVAADAGFLFLRHHVIGSTPALSSQPVGTLLNTIAVVVRTSVKVFFVPDGMVVEYPMRLYPSLTPAVLVSWAVVAACIAACAWLVRRAPSLGFWFVWFFAWLFLSCNVGELGDYMFAEKWIYLPAAGLCVVIAALLLRLRFGMAILAVLLSLDLGAVVVRSAYWRSQLVFFQQMVASAPDFPMARYMLGMEYASRGELARAAEEFEECARMQPRNSWALNNLGNCWFQLGDRARAGAAWTKAYAVDPKNYYVAFNLGMLSEIAGRPADAVRYYRLYLRACRYPAPALEARVEALERALAPRP